MQIHFVGSGDASGNGGPFQTCIRLQAAAYTVLVDCGATSLTAMKAQHLDLGEVEAVVLSHLHGDHSGGLPFLILDGQFTRRSKPLTVLGPAGTRDRLHPAMETLYPGSASARRRFPVEITELGGVAAPQRPADPGELAGRSRQRRPRPGRARPAGLCRLRLPRQHRLDTGTTGRCRGHRPVRLRGLTPTTRRALPP